MSYPVQVGVVIVTYKTAMLTVEALASVAEERDSKSNLNIRAIVVDNASGDTDYVQNAIDQRGWGDWASVITSPRNGGFGFGNNHGFEYLRKQSQIDYVYFLNPDARCLTGAISQLINVLDSNPKIGIVGSGFFNGDGTLWPIAFRFPTLMGEIDAGFKIGIISRILSPWVIAKSMEQINQPIDWVAGASMMIRTSLMIDLAGFDESYFLYYEETDLCYRAKKIGYETWYVPKSQVIHIAGQSTKVTGRKLIRKRFPAYWYESRSLFYLKNFGFFYSILADILAVFATMIGNFRLICLKRPHDTPTFFALDVISNSVLFRRIRDKKSFKSSLK